jgi:hypothetical protein
MPEPTYKKLNNPAPQDLSLYDDSQAGQKTDDLSVYNYQDVDGITYFNTKQAMSDGVIGTGNTPITYDEQGRPRITIAPVKVDQGTTGQSINPNAPEDPLKVYDDAIIRQLRTNPSGSKYLGTDGSFNFLGLGLGNAPTKVTKSKNVTNTTPPVFGADLASVRIDARRNELHNFSSYTYNIALYMMDSNRYIDLTKSPRNIRQVLASSQLLMRSGGVGFEGSALFGDQYYIDDLEVFTVGLGPSKFKHNTNSTGVSFKVYEPRGVTLLDNLRKQASEFLRTGERYIQAPYLLEISFKGYDANGTPSTDIVTPKYIPIKITDFDFQVQDSGSVYKIEAIPYAHFAYGQVTSTIPVNLEIKASTIGEIFSAKALTSTEEFDRYEYGGAEDDDGEPVTKTVYGTTPTTLGEALTNHYKNQTKRPADESRGRDSNGDPVDIGNLSKFSDAKFHDVYDFTIADRIANAKINHTELFEALNSPMPKDKSSNKSEDASQFQAYAAGLAKQVQVDRENFVFKINAGTDLIKLINILVMHSDYMDSNILDNPSDGVTTGKPINWFKVSPFLEEFRGYDDKSGTSKYKINYAVIPQTVYGHDFPWAPKSLPPGDGVHKIYNYIYTGLNEDVLKFDLRFNTTYFRTMIAKNGIPDNDKPADADFVSQVKYVTNSVEGDTTNNNPSLKRARSKDLFSSMLADGMDLINLDLDIVGDPCYISTSEWLWQDLLFQGNNYGTAYMPDNTINFELGTPYILVNFQTPTDYDDVTGLADPNQLQNSRFSGKYKVTGIESTFSGGLFQQNLQGVRLDLQELRRGTTGRTGTSTNNTERVASTEQESRTLQNSSGYGEVGRIPSNSGAAKVINAAASEDAYNEIPQTFPLTNTPLTAEIAQGPDQSVNYIEDPDGVSATEQWLSRL